MTAAPTPPPAGWYPAPDGSSATWWWDGARWTQPPQQLTQRPATKTIAKLAMATQVLLIICGVVSLATIGVETFGISSVTGFLDGSESAVDLLSAYDQMTLVISILGSVMLVTTGVLWVIWQYRVAKQVVGLTRRSPGWHAGSWFIPIVSLWFPYENISDLWRAVGRSRPSWQIVWWLLWVVSNWVIQISTRIYITAEELDQFRIAMWVSLIGEILQLAAVPLAWLTIRGITQGLAKRSSVPALSMAV